MWLLFFTFCLNTPDTEKPRDFNQINVFEGYCADHFSIFTGFPTFLSLTSRKRRWTDIEQGFTDTFNDSNSRYNLLNPENLSVSDWYCLK